MWMPWSREFSVVILILVILVLRLNAAEQRPASPVGKPSPTTEANNPSKAAQPQGSFRPSAPIQPTSVHSTKAGDSYTYNYYYYYYPQEGRDLPAWLEAGATIALLVLAAWQMGFIKRSTKATENAATAASDNAKAAHDAATATERYVQLTAEMVEATKQSTELAQLALNANRPFLLIVDETLQNLEVAPAKNTRVHIQFAFKNCGKSPAIISKIRARLAIAKHRLPISSDASMIVEAFPEWGSCKMYKAIGWIDKFENILAADQKSTVYTVWLDTTMYPDIASGTLKPEIREGVMNLSLLVVLHGVITYTDVLQQEYPTEFRGYLKMRATNNERRFNFEFKDRERPKHEDED
jgi:hypothetical protein